MLQENREDKMVRQTSNEDILERVGEEDTSKLYTLHKEVNWIGRILRRNFHPHSAIEGQMTGV